MGQEDEFFSDLKEWSARKLKLITQYIDGFSRIVGRSFKCVYYVDGFAGRGSYEDGQKGSPVLAAELSLQFKEKGMPFSLNCINIEKDHGNFVDLCAETRKFGSFVLNLEGSFENNIDAVLSRIGATPSIFFLDDFGVKGTDWPSVEKLIARKYPTDIWIRFDYRTAMRLSGFLESDAKDAQGKINTLQNLFGITDNDCLRSKLSGATPTQRVENAMRYYLCRLEDTFQKFGQDGFAASYPIVSISGERKYFLIFACSHFKAATLASNIVFNLEEEFKVSQDEHRQAATGQLSFLTEVMQKPRFAQQVELVRTGIRSLPKGLSMQREKLHYRLLVDDRERFGKFGKRQLTQAVRELSRETPARILCQGQPGDDSSIISILE